MNTNLTVSDFAPYVCENWAAGGSNTSRVTCIPYADTLELNILSYGVMHRGGKGCSANTYLSHHRALLEVMSTRCSVGIWPGDAQLFLLAVLVIVLVIFVIIFLRNESPGCQQVCGVLGLETRFTDGHVLYTDGVPSDVLQSHM